MCVWAAISVAGELGNDVVLRYFKVLQSLLGRGCWYIFLGSLALGTEWWEMLFGLSQNIQKFCVYLIFRRNSFAEIGCLIIAIGAASIIAGVCGLDEDDSYRMDDASQWIFCEKKIFCEILKILNLMQKYCPHIVGIDAWIES